MYPHFGEYGLVLEQSNLKEELAVTNLDSLIVRKAISFISEFLTLTIGVVLKLFSTFVKLQLGSLPLIQQMLSGQASTLKTPL
jgi:hypothetical protein